MRYLVHNRDHKNIGDNMGDLLVDQQLDALKCVADQNRRLKNRVFHGSLSLPPGESLTEIQWKDCAHQFMTDMGFSNAPYAIIRHFDKEYEHIHLCGSRVDYDGKTISDSRSYARAMESVRKLEKLYGLQEVLEHETKSKSNKKSTKEIHAERRGYKLIKTKIKEAIDAAISKSRGVNRKEFNLNFAKTFRQTGIEIQVHKHKNGEVYGMSFESNGIPFKSSKLGKNYQYTQLNKRLDLAFQMQLRHAINEKQKNSINEIDHAKGVNQTSQSKEIGKTNSPDTNKNRGISM
ncbi:relaxase/mobilization nuclease domain-containing protein [Reichenbachiella carrageenanivorans]|uniref:Relaxase/mobilization nuclease domain-containing protein n=1 Tax=Reichenbachiella carrageenanivorans TaxID=2979869 RepID=A0ABY6D0V2_9BACT|nr:relaxase/mobilization nuclease domain-containing protein [Reichenbachiella carrageenanivorans]UXX79782.1 relaxase/mobilization nuclease domain-containing protein [Reichenbachiella carrageenanivorans]